MGQRTTDYSALETRISLSAKQFKEQSASEPIALTFKFKIFKI